MSAPLPHVKKGQEVMQMLLQVGHCCLPLVWWRQQILQEL